MEETPVEGEDGPFDRGKDSGIENLANVERLEEVHHPVLGDRFIVRSEPIVENQERNGREANIDEGGGKDEPVVPPELSVLLPTCDEAEDGGYKGQWPDNTCLYIQRWLKSFGLGHCKKIWKTITNYG